MITKVSTERLFSLPSFEGLKLIRTYAAKQPTLNVEQIVELIEKIDSDGLSLDLQASSYLHTLVAEDCPMSGLPFYQECIKTIVIRHQPIWSKMMRAGRRRFVKTLNQDDQDVFGAAGLMIDPPPMDVVKWWDDVAGHARLKIDIEKMEQAREAELLSIHYETKRLTKIGIEKVPFWTGLDDNYAGYDVLSYDCREGEVVSIMIEVKSTIASPLRFYLTRNEWNQALKVGDAYFFHIWDMAKSSPELHIRTVDQIHPHIPSDNEKGSWSSVLIPLGPNN